MTLFSTLGLSSADDLNRVDSGKGQIHERTLELGDDVIVIGNIGSIRIIDGKKNHSATILGGLIAISGLGTVFSSKFLGLALLIVGLGLAAWNLFRAVEVYLSIGTCDGRSTLIVSKNRSFLTDVGTFLRHKIDTGSQGGATINISGSKLEGTFVIGTGGKAQSGS